MCFWVHFNLVRLTVHVVPPVFGSSLAEIVPPVIMIATFGSFGFFSSDSCFFSVSFAFSNTLASSISDSRIPML